MFSNCRSGQNFNWLPPPWELEKNFVLFLITFLANQNLKASLW
jgi:hypothetical protein